MELPWDGGGAIASIVVFPLAMFDEQLKKQTGYLFLVARLFMKFY